MLKINREEKTFQTISKSNLKDTNILERYDLQKYITSGWDLFRNEISLPSAYLIGEEIRPDDSTQNSLDILAFDPDDLSLVVIELKRSKNKLQLLQALSYAAMVSKWKKETIIDHIMKFKLNDYDELLDIFESNEISSEVKVILVAEKFDPEVIVTSDWLSSYSLSIHAYSIGVHQHSTETFLTVDQRYPLKGLSDVYDSRTVSRDRKTVMKYVNWEDILKNCNYDFAPRALEMCRKLKEGDPRRKRFPSLISKFGRFEAITLYLLRDKIRIAINGATEEDIIYFNEKFSTSVEITSWRDGLSLHITSEEQFMEFCALDDRLNY